MEYLSRPKRERKYETSKGNHRRPDQLRNAEECSRAGIIKECQVKTLEIHNQEDYDANKDFDGILIIKAGLVRASDNAPVRAWGNAIVEASGNATVKASGNATVRASGNATVWASDNATVWASDNATVRASDNATVRASGNATVEA